MKNITILIVTLISLQFGYAQQWKLNNTFQSQTPKDGDKYGVSVAINKNYYFIAASLDDESVVGTTDETRSNGGAVYVYNANDNSFHQKIFPSTPMKSAYFGNNIDADDTHLVIGSYYAKHDVNTTSKEGLAYVFTKNTSNNWEEIKILKQSNPVSFDLFGRNVAVNNNYILVTANLEDEGEKSSGAGYIFFKDEGGTDNWGEQAKLKATDIQENAYLGWSGDLDGNYAVMGAYRYDNGAISDTGAAYVFKRDGTTWSQDALLLPTDLQSGDNAGYDVAIHKNLIAVSAPNAHVNGFDEAGKVYVYEKDASDKWKLIKTLTPPTSTSGANFGHKVSIENDKLIISSKGYNDNQGKVYIFTKKDSNWNFKEVIKQNGNLDDNFGTSVAINNETILVGSDEGSDRVGAAYNYKYSYRFQNVSSAINNFYYTSLDWGDFNNDGYKDLIISGGVDTTNDDSADKSDIKLYKNLQNGTFEEVATPNIYGLHLGAVKFVDIDNDGDLDVVATGQNYNDITKYYLFVYENNNGAFTKKQELDGVIYASLNFGDYDNNGTLDLLLTGASQTHGGAGMITKIYKNTSGTLAETNIDLPGVQNGNAEFADIDNDGDLDILLMGTDKDDTYTLKTFENNNATFTEKQNLPGMYLGWFDFGDFDADGDLDFAIMGDDTNDDYAAKIYKNNDGLFTEHANLKGIDISSGTNSVQWGDYDNDGDLDLVFSGTDENYDDVTLTYKNTNANFTIENEGITNKVGGNLGWVDYDTDGDLDILVSGFHYDVRGEYVSGTFLMNNTTEEKNEKPNIPTNLSIIKNQNDITFNWDAASDDYTDSKALYYILNVGTEEDKTDVASYKVYSTSWTLKELPSDEYFWSVRAVDASQMMSNIAKGNQISLSTKDDRLLASSVNIYPNPTQNIININLKNNIEVKELTLFNLQGKKVFGKNKLDSSNFKIHMNSLNSGVYVLKIKTLNSTYNQKIIKK